MVDSESLDETSRTDDEPRTPGRLLREAREARELSVERLSRALNLDLATVTAIETDRYADIGAPVFVRGHLKKYAQLVGIPEADVLRAYERLTGPGEAVQLHALKPEGAPDKRLGPWPLLIVLLILVAGIAVWLLWPSSAPVIEAPVPVEPDSAGPGGAAPATAPVDMSAAPTQPPASAPGSEAAGETASAGETGSPSADGEAGTPSSAPPEQRIEVPVSPAPEAPTVNEASERVAVPATRSGSGTLALPPPGGRGPASESADPVALAGGVALEFRFSADSWIDVRDADGTRLAYELGREGTVRSLRGEPPFSVFLGYVDGVTVVVDGSPWPVPNRVRRGNTARFTLDAP